MLRWLLCLPLSLGAFLEYGHFEAGGEALYWKTTSGKTCTNEHWGFRLEGSYHSTAFVTASTIYLDSSKGELFDLEYFNVAARLGTCVSEMELFIGGRYVDFCRRERRFLFDEQMEFQAGGPEFGVSTRWPLLCGLSLEWRAIFSALVGDRRPRLREGDIVLKRPHSSVMAPAVDLRIQINTHWLFCSTDWRLWLGYECNHYWNIFQPVGVGIVDASFAGLLFGASVGY